MLIIRNEQMDALRQYSLRNFEKRLIIHFREHFPDQCAALDEKDLREIVRQGIERAASFGFTSERDVCRYISLTVYFGPDFDTEQSWARSILHGPPWSESIPMIDRLFEVALEHADTVAKHGGKEHG